MKHNSDELLLKKVVEEIKNKSALLIDIREDIEWNNGHIKDAIHIPLSKIQKDRIQTFPSSAPQSTLYIHCASGGRVRYAIEELKWGKDQQDKKVIPLYLSFEEITKFFTMPE